MDKSQETGINDLIVCVREHDDAAFTELVKRYTPMIKKVIVGFYSPNINSDEAFSEACVGLYRAALSYDFSRSDITFGLYARVCVYHRMCDLFGKDVSAKYALIDDLDVESFPVSDALENSIVGREMLNGHLARAREILSEYEYNVFLLYIEGYATSDIAKELNRSAKSVDNAKARIFRRLREEKNRFSTFD